MARYSAMVVLAKVETTYATDVTPTNIANACLFQDVTWTPMEADQVERPMVLPYFGNDPVYLVAQRNRLSGAVDLAGSGTAGTAPAFAPLLRACGLAEAITVGTKVDYTPISSAEESLSVYHYIDGQLQKGLGVRGDFTLELAARQIPRLRFDLQGLYNAPSAVALPVPTLTAWKDPLPVSKANTLVATLGGNAVNLLSLSYTHGNQIAVRDLPNSQAIRIVGRQPRGSITVEMPDALTPNLFSLVGTTQAVTVTHGTAAGGKATVTLGQARLLNPRLGNDNNITTVTFDLRPEPTSAGNNEFLLSIL